MRLLQILLYYCNNRYWTINNKKCTQESHHHPFLDHLHRARGDVEDGRDNVPGVNQVLVWGTEGGLDGQGDGLEAALGCCLEEGQAEDLLVEVQTEVAPELLGVIRQNLTMKRFH